MKTSVRVLSGRYKGKLGTINGTMDDCRARAANFGMHLDLLNVMVRIGSDIRILRFGVIEEARQELLL